MNNEIQVIYSLNIKKDADNRLRLWAHHKPRHTKREVCAIYGLLNACRDSSFISEVVIQRRLSYEYVKLISISNTNRCKDNLNSYNIQN